MQKNNGSLTTLSVLVPHKWNSLSIGMNMSNFLCHVCIIQLSLKEYSYYILNHNLSSFKTKNKQVCQMSNYKLVMFNMKFKTCMLMCLC